jgi:hypothetical protein
VEARPAELAPGNNMHHDAYVWLPIKKKVRLDAPDFHSGFSHAADETTPDAYGQNGKHKTQPLCLQRTI